MIVSSMFILLAALGLLTTGIYTDSNSYLYSSIAASLLAGVALFFGARSRARRNEEAAAESRVQSRSASRRSTRGRAGDDPSRSATRAQHSDAPGTALPTTTDPRLAHPRDAVTHEFTPIKEGHPPPDPDGQGLPPRTNDAGPTGQVPSQRSSIASPPYADGPPAYPDSRREHTPSHGTRLPSDLQPPGEWPPLEGDRPSTSDPSATGEHPQWSHWEESSPTEWDDQFSPPFRDVRSPDPAARTDDVGIDDRFSQLTGSLSAESTDNLVQRGQSVDGSSGEYAQLRSDIAHWSEAAHEAANWEDGPADEPVARDLTSIEAAQLMRLEAVVEVVDGRPRFHLGDCTHLIGRDHEPLDLNEAIELGFSPCGECDPVAHFSATPALQ